MTISFDVNVENEQIVLGALLADAEQRRRFLPRARPDLFVDPVNRSLVEVLRELERRGVPYAADTVEQLTAEREKDERVSFKYLEGLEEDFGALPDENLEVHLELLTRSAAKERAREGFEELFDSLDDVHAPLERVETAASEILRAVRETSATDAVRRGKDLCREWEDRFVEAAAGRGENFRPFYFSGLDEELYEAAKPGNLSVVAARPGMGKTTWVSNVLLRQTLRGRRCLSLPIEPGTDAVIEQMACARARVSAEKVIKAPDTLTREEVFAMKRAAREILDGDLLDLNETVVSLDELESLVAVENYDLVAIDLWEYLMDDLDPRIVTQALRRLKLLAKRRKFHVIVVHQIKRIKRIKNPRPQLHELKNSGGYEEVADLVMLLHRAIYYNKTVEKDVLEIDVAKQRRGPQNVRVGFEFHPEVCRVGKHIEGFDPRDLR